MHLNILLAILATLVATPSALAGPMSLINRAEVSQEDWDNRFELAIDTQAAPLSEGGKLYIDSKEYIIPKGLKADKKYTCLTTPIEDLKKRLFKLCVDVKNNSNDARIIWLPHSRTCYSYRYYDAGDHKKGKLPTLIYIRRECRPGEGLAN